ncbi:hypothetical protein D3C79_548310 [compost metagenome]
MPNMLSGAGTFRVQLLEGTWLDGGSFTGQIPSKGYAYIQGTIGPDGNTPVSVIDGTGSTKTAGIYMDGGPSNLCAKDIMCNNFRANSVASGFVFTNKGISRLLCDNLYTNNNLWAGINADSIGQFYMWGGVHNGNTNYNIRVRGGVQISVGRPNQRKTFLLNSVGASVQIRDACTGHFDYVDIKNHPTTPRGTGVWVTNCSRVTYTGVILRNCSVGTECGVASTFSPGDVVYDNVPTRFRCTGSGAQDRDVDRGSLGGQGWDYDSYFDRYSLAANVSEINPPSATSFFYASQKTGLSAITFNVPRATVAQHIFGNADGNSLLRRDYDIPNLRVQDVINGVVRFRISATDVNPVQDNQAACGNASARWTVVHAATGTIATSDERHKMEIRPIDDACLHAWSKVEYVQYKFKDAAELKGEDAARWHFGLIAQRVKEVFESEGLDAFEYGLLCYDEWDAVPAETETHVYGDVRCIATGDVLESDVPMPTTEAGKDWHPTREEVVEIVAARPAGNRYGIRYEEALALECAYLRSQL